MTQVWFIRHGESASNARRTTNHPATIPLTERGRQQAERIVHAFTQAPDLIAISPYRRARDTAEATRRAFPSVAVEEWPVQEFTYLSPARYQGTTVDDRRSFVLDYWRRLDPDFLDGDGAESFRGLMARVERTQEMLDAPRWQKRDRLVAVFSHGQFIRALLWWCLRGTREVDAGAMTQFLGFLRGVVVPNGGIVPVDVAEGGLVWGGIRVSHLESVSWPEEASHDAIWSENGSSG